MSDGRARERGAARAAAGGGAAARPVVRGAAWGCRRVVRRVGRVVWRGLVAYGSLYLAGACERARAEHAAVHGSWGPSGAGGEALSPCTHAHAHGGGGVGGGLCGPVAGHPERLCAEVPLSPLERALERELDQGRGRGRGWGWGRVG
ncbi:DUF6059 family protein [Streptomyces sp. NPDC003023]|uniref:DUF6059 family protein n=1 Tax=Streptomyces sp. NPDC003023 TaxID=3364675 RepID=UPI0036BF429A